MSILPKSGFRVWRMDRVKCALCVFVLGLVLGTGQARDLFSAYPKPANLSDHYTLSGTGDDPWFWTCKKGVPLLHGRVKSNQLEVFGPTAPSDLQCAAMIAYISTFQRDPKNERAYVNAMLNAAEWSIPVRRVYSKRLLKSKYLEEVTINTVEALIKNKSTKPQEGSTPHYTESATDSHEVTIGVESSIESKSTIGVPLVGSTEFTMRLGASYSNTNAHSETREISAPSQKMTLDPKTQALVSFTFWKKKKRNEYKLAFEVDEEDHFRRLKDQVKRKEIELKLYRGSSDPFVKFENDRFIVGDFPVTQTLWTYGVNVTFGEPEPLANDLPPGVMEVNF